MEQSGTPEETRIVFFNPFLCGLALIFPQGNRTYSISDGAVLSGIDR